MTEHPNSRGAVPVPDDYMPVQMLPLSRHAKLELRRAIARIREPALSQWLDRGWRELGIRLEQEPSASAKAVHNAVMKLER